MAASKNSGLRTYRAKRSEDRTREPVAGRAVPSGQRFVVQQHAATRLHYDFRLELDGVLKSWAVPKGPSPNPQDKRLAVQTEDHPVDYADFEGQIPAGNYGAGAVIVWDRGNWKPLADDPIAALQQGKLAFELNGYKLRGRWALVKTKRGDRDWLLIKENDAYTETQGTEIYPPDSILSGLTVEQLAKQQDPALQINSKLKKQSATHQRLKAKGLRPMLATTTEVFDDPLWLFEIKYDGYRLLVCKDGDTVTLYSRNGHDLTATFPEIADAVARLPYPYLVLDAEAVVHDQRGLPSFSLLQKRGRLTRRPDIQRAAISLPASLYAFDLLGFGDYDLRDLELVTRKALLREILPTVGPIRYSEHIDEHGNALYAQTRALHLEGIVAKRRNSKYQSGRSDNWRKVPLERRDDFVVVGYTDPTQGQRDFGALLLAQYVDGALRFTGRVGSGFTHTLLRDLAKTLAALPKADPVVGAPKDVKGHWVEPTLVCEVKFKQITTDGLLRAPVFLRLRDDKSPKECARGFIEHSLPEPDLTPGDDHGDTLQLSNLDKIFWPDEGYSKGDLLDHYRNMSGWLLPFLKDRPVVLTRYPDGIDGKHFYQKDAPQYVPDWMRIEHIWSESSGREIGYFVIDDLDSLLYVVNMGSIPIHCWLSRSPRLEQPDWCVLDIDPKQAPFKHVIIIAKTIHQLCDTIGLPNFIKTSGSTGAHILIPLGSKYTYEQSRTLAELLANIIVKQLPEIATVTRHPEKREGKVYIDFLQNRHGQTIAAPYCVRPLPGAPVSMPVKWSEVNTKLHNQRFTIANATNRMRRLKEDPWRDLMKKSADLPAALERLSQVITDE